MPAGTSPEKLLTASRAFAREQFAFKHRFAMVLHTDQKHPHVHVVIKAMSEQGERLNIRKATLREWRGQFARHLREQGVNANATERAVRGESRTRKTDAIFRVANRGASTHLRDRVEGVAAELLQGTRPTDPGKSRLIRTRHEVRQGWQAVSAILARQGEGALAQEIRQYLASMPPPKTEREALAEALMAHSSKIRDRGRPVTRSALRSGACCVTVQAKSALKSGPSAGFSIVPSCVM